MAASSNVVRRPQNLVRTSTRALPAMVARAVSAATTPATHTASRPSSPSRYGCQADQLHIVNTPCTSHTSISSRIGLVRQPNATLVCSTRRIAAGIAEMLVVRGVNPTSCIAIRPTTNTAPSSNALTRNGHARPRLPSTPPPTDPTSIAAPDTICLRAKTRSSCP
jgi:hypothetical protein